MSRDRVLVAMSRSEAEWYDALGEGTGHGPTHRPIRAALDTDREQQVVELARIIYQVKDDLGESQGDLPFAAASAVLSVLEGADDE